MADTSTNDTIFEEFLYIIDLAIEQGNPNILQHAIKEYSGNAGKPQSVIKPILSKYSSYRHAPVIVVPSSTPDHLIGNL